MTSSPLPDSLIREYEALTTGAGCVDLSEWTQIELTGRDRASFLNGFCTNDVKRLQPGEGCEAFVTDVKGRVLGHVFLFAGTSAISLVTVPEQAARLLGHLDRYRITEDVELVDRSGSHALWFLAGQQAADALRQLLPIEVPDRPWSHVEASWGKTPVLLRRAMWTKAAGFLLVCPKPDQAAVGETLIRHGAALCGPEAFDMVRVEAAMPLYGRDVTEQNLPQEVDRDDQAISFTKGCYLGQETVARLDALGHVNRLLRKLTIAAATVPAAGTELRADDRCVGQVTSAVWSPSRAAPIAVGYVRREHSAPGTELQIDVGLATVAGGDSG